MRRPSPRVLSNRCTVWPYAQAQDDDAGNDLAACYPASAGTFACSHQCETAERVDENGRVSTAESWTVLFAAADVAPLNLKVNDRLDLLDAGGSVFRAVFVAGAVDMASRGAAVEVPCRDAV